MRRCARCIQDAAEGPRGAPAGYRHGSKLVLETFFSWTMYEVTVTCGWSKCTVSCQVSWITAVRHETSVDDTWRLYAPWQLGSVRKGENGKLGGILR